MMKTKLAPLIKEKKVNYVYNRFISILPHQRTYNRY